jgi:tetratricopeptide (TPR) repeat protein
MDATHPAGDGAPSAEPETSTLGADGSPGGPLPRQIGRYRILRLIGQGGMGAVYEAVQDKPDRQVALKVIKPGATSRDALRRFEQETQLLGKLHHPGIAQIYEAGTADAGQGPQPYFAMELVHGFTLRDHAERSESGPREKLALVAKICDAVHHAHQKGVIHRDLKPGNILVDESGQPTILDFGVARATDSDRQATMQTNVGQIVGTLPYMSPEQITADPLELDTRSDVYALGVILYELLAGRLPYDAHRGTLTEVLRTICEEEPKALGTVDRRLRGDVETIVAKALEKDRERRYGSAAELAADIRRHLTDEPIVARPPSATYQLSKFARRNKVLVGGVAAVFLVLVGGVLAASRQASRARREAVKAEAVSTFVRQMLSAASPRSLTRDAPDRGRTITVVQALGAAVAKLDSGELRREPLVEAAVRQTVGATFRDLGDYASAEPSLRAALDARRRLLGSDDPEVAESLDGLAQLLVMRGKPAEADPLFREALAIRRSRARDEPDNLAASLNGLAESLQDQLGESPDAKKAAEAESLFREALDVEQRYLADGTVESARAMHGLALLLHSQGKPAEAEPLFRKALELRRRLLGPDHPDVASTLYGLALLQQSQGARNEAIGSMQEAVHIWRRVLGEEHPFLTTSLASLGSMMRDEGRLPEAASLLRSSLAIQRRTLSQGDAQLGGSLYNLAKVLQAEGKPAEAEPPARESLEIMRKAMPADHPTLAAIMAGLGSILTDDGRPAEAEPLLRQALAIDEKALPADDWQRSQVRSLLGAALLGRKRYAEAEPLLVGGYNGLKDSPAVSADRKRRALERVVQLYREWSLAEPSASRSETLVSWRAALAAAERSSDR